MKTLFEKMRDNRAKLIRHTFLLAVVIPLASCFLAYLALRPFIGEFLAILAGIALQAGGGALAIRFLGKS